MAAETLTWVAADGSTHTWPSNLLEGLEGRGMPPVSSFVDEVPGRHGGIRRSARYTTRRIVIPMALSGSYSAVRAALRAFMSTLDTTDGDGVLRFTTYDGSVREIDACYVGGLELVETNRVQLATAEFECVDPFFRDADWTEVSAAPVEATPFLPLTLPLTLSVAGISASPVVTNTGDMEAWPQIVLTGPIVNPVVTCGTRSLRLMSTIADGETVTIDSSPSARTVVSTTGDNLFALLSPGSAFFPLPKGATTVVMEATGTGPNSLMTLRYRRRWLSA